MERATNSSSSIDSSSHPSLPQPQTDLSTDLRLGLGLSTSQIDNNNSSNSREHSSDSPPIKPRPVFFIKVYMEGIPIGRKLDLFSHQSYDGLIRTLGHMFNITILCPVVVDQGHSDDQNHVLAYEDKEGDWMMVGDVPWEMFLTTVKRLKITRSLEKC